MDHAARSKLLLEFRVLRIVDVFRLLFGIQVVEVAEEFMEAIGGRQHLIPITQVVLAELTRCIAQRLEQRGDGRVFRFHAFRCTGKADLSQSGPDRRLAGDECGAPGSAALLAIPVGKHRPILCDAVDVRCPVAHQALIVGADVEAPDVIAPDDEDVGLLLLSEHRWRW